MQLLTGGPIITMGRHGTVEAVAIDDGRIVAVGELKAVMGPSSTG